jgi:hypothetical protein
LTRLWAIAVLTVGVVVACDKVPLTSPTGSTININIDQTTLPIGGQTSVRAVVTESSGQPVHNGTEVNFIASLGSFNPPSAETVNGVATTTFIAGTTSGTTKINAYSGGASTGSGNSSSGGIEVKIGTAGTERVAVRTEPLNVPVTGGTVVVVAAIYDASGNAIKNTPVTFSSDFGSLSSAVATTDSNGEARVSLTTNRTTKITVTAGAKTGDFTLAALTPPSVTLACSTGTATNVGTVGLPLSCKITPTVSGNNSSSAPIQNVTINWGDNTGEQPLGVVTGETTVAHTYTSAGLYQVQAAATDTNSQRGVSIVSVNVTRSLPTITFSTCPSATGTVNVPMAFGVTPATSPTIPLQNVTITFGDGSSRDLGQITGATGFTKAFSAEGGYTVTATVTDTIGQRGTSSCSVVVAKSATPTITFSQTSNKTPAAVVGTPETFSITITGLSSGVTIQQVTVTLERTGEVLYNQASAGTFATSKVQANDILTLRVTDSTGNVTVLQLVVDQ